ncbi:MAG: SynChlorMet cassette radical SAM/SPASM protein ScmF [Desulforhabdus sp.]|nr:SynChlorMet cassette radical SAM/SPASM protein ScmF [Desulforhabdus sp.]
MSETPLDIEWPLRQIYFYLTDGCNLRCRHCWITPKFQGTRSSHVYLDVEILTSIVEQAIPLGLTGIKLSGGEPLLHPQFIEIIRFIKTKELRLTIETNGVLCTKELALSISAHREAFVSISLDGADAQTHEWVRGMPGCFKATLQGVRNLVRAGLKPQIIFTLMRRNADQVGQVIHLAEQLGAGSVKLNVLQPTERGALMHESDQALTIKELIELGRWVEGSLAQLTELKLIIHFPPAFRPLSRLFDENGDDCAVCGIKEILGVLGDGSYALCGIGESTPELVFGHAESVQLKRIWQEHAVLKQLRTGLPERLEGICAECLMKSICSGACIAQNFYSNGSLWGPYWFCQQAYNEQLFPETRLHPSTFYPKKR